MKRKEFMKILKSIKNCFSKHYVVISGYSGRIVRCCSGYKEKHLILEGDREATFKKIPKEECPYCSQLLKK